MSADAGDAAAPPPRHAPTPPPPLPLPAADLAALASALQCPVCLGVLTDPLTTPCGHAYCAACVSRALEARPQCPTCGAPVPSASACTPSHALRAVAARLGPAALAAAHVKAAVGAPAGGPAAAAGEAAPLPASSTAAAVWALLDQRGRGGGGGGGTGTAHPPLASSSDLLPPVDDLSPADLDALISGLISRRAALAARDAASDLKLLLRFLKKARSTQAARLAAAQSEVAAVDADLAWVAAKVAAGGGGGGAGAAATGQAAIGAPPTQLLLEGGGGQAAAAGATTTPPPPPPPPSTHLTAVDPAALKAGKRRLADAFDDLQECYLALRREREAAAGERAGGSGHHRLALTAAGDCSAGGGGGDAAQAVVPSDGRGSTALVPVGMGGGDRYHHHHQASSDHQPPAPPPPLPPPQAGGPGPALAEVSRLLAVCVRAGRLTHVASLPAAGAGHTGGAGTTTTTTTTTPAASSIISSVEFDASTDRFASAGVAKQVAVWDLAAVLEAAKEEEASARAADPGRTVRSGGGPGASASPPPPPHLSPAIALSARAKLSCLSWARAPGGPTHLLASADYEGGVTLWDVANGTAVVEYDAHDRRAWSVDFCPVLGGGGGGGGGGGATTFATASDDGTARVWCARSRTPVATLSVGANVCCARFAPAGMAGAAAVAGCELALGSADHLVRVFDLRATGRGPLATLSGHAQAVSYVRYAPGGPGLVSASTDATLRLWRRGWADGEDDGATADAATTPSPPHPPPRCVRVYRGHANERNFVGLDAAGDLVAAGSETGEVVVYAAALSRPIARAACDGGGGGGVMSAAAPVPGGLPAPPAFVSAVCWRPGPGDGSPGPASLPRTLLAATSRGGVHVLELGAAAGGGAW